MIIRTGKVYDNSNGYFFYPAVWRDEFGIKVGDTVGIDSLQGEVVIDKRERKYKRKILDRGKVNIPLELRVQLQDVCYEILIEQDKERVILTPK
ncbi:hypothetical protein ACFFJY_02860 [Fictibacillus aquaticus]|uniref:SpoVT-AbrB domain-containing protein n=1 Tax=Fictibacillus aquaticus TaxID=2021314 RepID=A0A235F8Z5_9BACL|nr:hypothetical protein [Fictibacillus aquaticus]OYD57639.1 hypothetical protein CGZ90_13320 [Fictibacillus aquaticus]